MHHESTDWSYALHEEPDGRVRVVVTDENGVAYPVARQFSAAQAERLVAAIRAESRTSRRPIKAVIRDPAFMATTVVAIKRSS